MSHSCNHPHTSANFSNAFAIGVGLNVAYVVFEVGYGLIGHSLALLADAGHNLSDVLGLLLAWGASAMARTRPSKRRTYGLRGSSILAALFNAVLLLVSVGAIAWEAIRRFSEPPLVSGKIVIGVSLVGIVINTITAWRFAAGRNWQRFTRPFQCGGSCTIGANRAAFMVGVDQLIEYVALPRDIAKFFDRRTDFIES